jgi:hypothetical protein
MKTAVFFLALIILISCSNYRVVEMRRISKDYYLTTRNETLKVKGVMIKNIGDTAIIGAWIKNGKVIDGKFIKARKDEKK